MQSNSLPCQQQEKQLPELYVVSAELHSGRLRLACCWVGLWAWIQHSRNN